MANIIAYRASDKFVVQVGSGKVYRVASANFDIVETGATTLVIYYDPIGTSTMSWQGSVSEVLDKDGVAYGTTMQDVHRGIGSGIDVTLQDQTTFPIIAHFTKTVVQTTLAVTGAIDDLDIEVDSATSIVVGQHVTIFNAEEERVFFAHVLVIASTTITLDSPLDFAFPSGSIIDFSDDNLAVDGSSTTQIFGLRGGGTPPGVDLDFDVTKIIFQCTTATASTLSTFGDLGALTNGLILRRRDGIFQNIFNVKTNGDIADIGMLIIHEASNPAQGQDGFIATLRFAGQNEIGVSLRIGVGEDLEVLVPDNISGITILKILALGHIVEY